MKFYLKLLILFSFTFFFASVSDAQRAFGGHEVLLDDGSGHTITIVPSSPSSTYVWTLPSSIPVGGAAFVPVGTTTNSTLYWNGSQWAENVNVLSMNNGGFTAPGSVNLGTTNGTTNNIGNGGNTTNNIFGDHAANNYFGDTSAFNDFGSHSPGNIFGSYASTGNVFGNSAGTNYFGAACSVNYFGNASTSNYFGVPGQLSNSNNYYGTSLAPGATATNYFGDNFGSGPTMSNSYGSDMFGAGTNTNSFGCAGGGAGASVINNFGTSASSASATNTFGATTGTNTYQGPSNFTGALTVSTGAGGFALGSGANATTLTSAATSPRAISFPNAGGTLGLSGATNQSNFSGLTHSSPSTSPIQVGIGAGGASITPSGSGKVLIIISGLVGNSTASDGVTLQISYGTGAAPNTGDPATGTAVGTLVYFTEPSSGTITVPFSTNVVVTGLTVGSTYWIDLQMAAISGGTASVGYNCVSAVELP